MMIKKLTNLMLVVSILSVCMVSPVAAEDYVTYADDSNQYYSQYQWSHKLGRGVVNVFSSPIEIIRGVDLTSKSDGALKGWTAGIMMGFAGGILRFATGAVDVFTFPFNFPEEDKGPIINPEYVWDDWHGEYLD